MARPNKTSAAQAETVARGGTPSLLETLRRRFEANPGRHLGLGWHEVEARLDTERLARVASMEETGGEPDVVLLEGPGRLMFVDCAPQSPNGRRSLCYDRDAWQARREARPLDTALDVAARMGVELLTEQDYRALQELGEFDTTTSSWVVTPTSIRAAGGALFGDRRFNHVFIYHNGAQSYYAARGFRAKLIL